MKKYRLQSPTVEAEALTGQTRVSTPEGEVFGYKGDWVVKLSPGVFVVMKADSFWSIYEPLEPDDSHP